MLRAPTLPLTLTDPKALFGLDRSYTFLNHGSFGACPNAVLAAQDRSRREIEARPIELLGRKVESLLAPSRAAVAAFVGTDPAGLGFMVNATEGVNAALQSIAWKQGDEVLALDMLYNAVRKSVQRMHATHGITLREVETPSEGWCGEALAQLLIDAIAPNTRLVIIDHVTSPTAIIIDVARVIQTCRARGVLVLVDGAHAPGMLDLSIDALDADWYTANLHKWTCAPKGCGMLVTPPRHRETTHPLATSHHFELAYTKEFDWQGTRDITAWMHARTAIAFFEQFGWQQVREHNHALAVWAAEYLCDAWSVRALTDTGGASIGSMCPVRVPDATRASFASVEALQAALYDQERVEVPVIDWKGAWHVRVSAHLHTSTADIERLAEAMQAISR
ncbi:MAG: aminotransferase class V-fold PLP-dependent enzyme [Phycisphaerales bacterium]|nr:aminotransferase class V-fold PLP-dependent enzyme [Phycisphaerales bacterium]